MSNVRQSKMLKLIGPLLLALGLVLGLGGSARAEGAAAAADALDNRARGRIDVHAEGTVRSSQRVELTGSDTELAGKFVIENEGTGPLNVTRVAVRTSPTDPRTPPGVTAELEGGATAQIAPGQSKNVIVKWHAGDGRRRLRRLYARRGRCARGVAGPVAAVGDATSTPMR